MNWKSWPPLLERDDPFKGVYDAELLADILEVLWVRWQPCQHIWVHRWPALKKCPRYHDSWPRCHWGIHWQTRVNSQVRSLIFITWNWTRVFPCCASPQKVPSNTLFFTQSNATVWRHSHLKQFTRHRQWKYTILTGWHSAVRRLMENKKKTVEEFLQQGEKLMELPGSPKFLETHVNKLKEAWAVNKNILRAFNYNHSANSFPGGERRSTEAEEWSGRQSWGLEELWGETTGLLENAWHGGRWAEISEEKLQHGASTHRAAGESQSGSHYEVIFDIFLPFFLSGPCINQGDQCLKKCCCRFDIEDLFKQAEAAFKTLSIFAPKEKAEELGVHITTLNERLEVAHWKIFRNWSTNWDWAVRRQFHRWAICFGK